MTPSDFVQECDRRGIALSLLSPLSPGELPRIHYRVQGKLPPSVLETIKKHKAAIVAVLESETGVSVLPDGRKLYQWGEADWRYVPPGEDPADFRSNFPPGYVLPRPRCAIAPKAFEN